MSTSIRTSSLWPQLCMLDTPLTLTLSLRRKKKQALRRCGHRPRAEQLHALNGWGAGWGSWVRSAPRMFSLWSQQLGILVHAVYLRLKVVFRKQGFSPCGYTRQLWKCNELRDFAEIREARSWDFTELSYPPNVGLCISGWHVLFQNYYPKFGPLIL